MNPTPIIINNFIAAQKTIGIVGAAVAGPTLAVQILSHPILRRLYKPVIYDQHANVLQLLQQDPESGRSRHTAGAAVALSPNGLYPLYELGLKDAINEFSAEIPDVKIWRASRVATGAASGLGMVGSQHVHVRDVVPCTSHKLLNYTRNTGWSRDVETGMRAIERRHLQSVLLDRVAQLGGQVLWNKKLVSIESLDDNGGGGGATKLKFNDGTDAVVELLVGADGGWSTVRRHILKTGNLEANTTVTAAAVEAAVEKRSVPDFMSAVGFYGVSSRMDSLAGEDGGSVNDDEAATTHGIWLDQGNLSSSPLPDGKIRWDLILPQKVSPEISTGPASWPRKMVSSDTTDDGWESRIAPGAYSHSSSVEILRAHAGVWHPVTGTFGCLLEASERIIRTPLRQRVWDEKEIQHGNIVLIGDASRLMLPSSGQGSSFAIEDATILANSLLNHPPSPPSSTLSSSSSSTSSSSSLDASYPSSGSGSFRTALEEYAKIRVPRSKQMARMAYWVGLVGLGETWYWRLLRDYGSAWAPAGEDPKKSGKQIPNPWPFDLRLRVELKNKSLYYGLKVQE